MISEDLIKQKNAVKMSTQDPDKFNNLGEKLRKDIEIQGLVSLGKEKLNKSNFKTQWKVSPID
jgi:hypothetical protein